MPEDVGLPSVESPLAEQILQLIDDYTESHPEMADAEMAEHINLAMREVQSMLDFVNSLRPKMIDPADLPDLPAPRWKTSYLYSNDDSVMLVIWTQTGLRLEGILEAWDMKPEGEVKLTMFQFEGTLNGENVCMALNPVTISQGGSHVLRGTITGALRGDVLTLPSVSGAGPIECRLVSGAEWSDAYRNLLRRAEKKKRAK